MSRGFVKEDDQEEIPIVPPRADLPVGTENLVTPGGYKELLSEREKLLAEQEQLDASNEKEYRIAVNYLNARLHLLNERINSAKVVDPTRFPQQEVHFGTKVTIMNINNQQQQTFEIVGVDEAKISKGKISFITPLAKALTGKKVGESAILKLPGRETVFKILHIS
ncbi:transcription elongation factor GreA [Chryseobacterium sp. 6424]|uniref:GreA/GreB family elongation factor n=1 Tax=Chryseobacterium sp. 6424 TaxID=2039166 RepID=UPI000EFD3647|nr:GreA/GreB family elongation factor [Chryseobacterium sp. 6424]AYO58104.1 transcription elongation factor GreA [Chryseobacterium sp. 6424]